MSQNLLKEFVDKLRTTVETKNSWGKNELLTEVSRLEIQVLHEELERLRNHPEVPRSNDKDLDQIK